jgi:hypothetical protein
MRSTGSPASEVTSRSAAAIFASSAFWRAVAGASMRS